MNTAKVIVPFAASVVLFVLAYLSSRDLNSGFFPIMLFVVGFIFAVAGIAAIFSTKKGE